MCTLFACSKHSTNLECPIYKITLNSDEKLDFMSLVDSLYYIELETTDESLIGEISQIIIDDYLFLLDRKNQSIDLFTEQGQFVSAISALGDGPGEYLRIDDFFVDSKRKIINILDGTRNKIIKYSFKGQYIEEIDIPLSRGISRFIFHKEQYYFDQQYRQNARRDSYNLIVMDSLCNILDREFYYNSYLDIILGIRKSLFRVNDTLHYIPLYSEIVYKIDDDNVVSPKYSLDFGDKWINQDYVFTTTNDPMAFMRGLATSGGIYFLSIIESTSHIFIDYTYRDTSYYSIINKRNSVVWTGQNISIDGSKGKLIPLATTNDFFILPIDRHNAPEGLQVENPDEYNPILMMLKFK